MIKNYLTVAFRNILRNKVFSIINITGLAIGIACSILILLWVMDELSYDQYHQKKENIYRVLCEKVSKEGALSKSVKLPYPLADAIKEEIPEIINVTRWTQDDRIPIKRNDIIFFEDTGCNADPSLLEMFTHPLIAGDINNLFPDKDAVVISERWAKKYFGKEDPIGKEILWNNMNLYTVRGVIKNLPENSHIKFDLISGFDNWKNAYPPSFTWNNYYHNIYIEIIPGSDIKEIEQKIKNTLFKHSSNKEHVNGIILQSLTDIHLTANIQNEYAKIVDKQYVYIYSLIAVLILVIACINYINLTTARSTKRNIEIGIRKTLGAERKKIIGQFMTESFLTALTAYILAMMAVEFFLPAFNLLVGKNLQVEYVDPIFLGVIFLILILSTLLAGVYPAFYLSAVKPIKVLKGIFNSGKKASVFRKSLVVFQFSISVLLLTGTIGIYLQMEYISNKKLGFNKEGVVYLPLKGSIAKNYDIFKKDLLTNSNILNVSIKNSLPHINFNKQKVDWNGKVSGVDIYLNLEAVGFDYFKTMGINIIHGRDFSEFHSSDAGAALIIDQNVAEIIGFNDPVGQTLNFSGTEVKIIGVINKTNFRSLHSKAVPHIYYLTNNYTGNFWNFNGVILINVNTRDIKSAVNKIGESWKKINPEIPIDLNFLDETYNKFYESEKQTIQTLIYFTCLAVFISCMGLFGLVAFSLEQKRKEIAIRKTFGASDRILVWGFMKSFSTLVIMAFIITVGPAYYFLYKWLSSFAYHITPGIELFLGIGFILFAITIITVGFNSLRAARVNPIQNLRED